MPTSTPASPHMSSQVTPKYVMNSLEQGSSGESIEGSTRDVRSKKFRFLTKTYLDILEEELDPDELVLLIAKELTTYVR